MKTADNFVRGMRLALDISNDSLVVAYCPICEGIAYSCPQHIYTDDGGKEIADSLHEKGYAISTISKDRIQWQNPCCCKPVTTNQNIQQ